MSEQEKNYYVVNVIESVSKSKFIGLYADAVSLEDSGDISFSVIDDDEEERIVLALASSQWKSFYLADPETKTPLEIDSWFGVVGIEHIIDDEDKTEKALEKALYKAFKHNKKVKMFISNVVEEMFEKEPTKEINEEEEKKEEKKE